MKYTLVFFQNGQKFQTGFGSNALVDRALTQVIANGASAAWVI